MSKLVRMKPGSESRSSVRFRRVFRLSTRNEFGGLLRRGTNSTYLTLLDDLLLSSSHWPLNRVAGAATYPERSILAHRTIGPLLCPSSGYRCTLCRSGTRACIGRMSTVIVRPPGLVGFPSLGSVTLLRFSSSSTGKCH